MRMQITSIDWCRIKLCIIYHFWPNIQELKYIHGFGKTRWISETKNIIYHAYSELFMACVVTQRDIMIVSQSKSTTIQKYIKFSDKIRNDLLLRF